MDKCNHVHLGYCSICAEAQIAALTAKLKDALQELAECKEKLELDSLDFKGASGGGND